MNKKNYLLMFLISLITLNIYGQFVVLPGVNMSVVTMALNGQNIFAGTTSGGVFFSSNSGDTWTTVNNGIPDMNITSLLSAGNSILAGTSSSGIYKTVNNGANWISVNPAWNTAQVRSLSSASGKVFAGVGNNLYESSDNGTTWSLNNFSSTHYYTNIIAEINNSLFLGTGGNGMFRSNDGGLNWVQINSGLGSTQMNVESIYRKDAYINIGTYGGVYRSSNNGDTWVPSNIQWCCMRTPAITSVGNYFLFGASVGIFWSSDNGNTWHDPNSQFMFGHFIWSTAQNSDYIYMSSGDGVWRRPISQLVGLQNISSETPQSFLLSQNYPNPFNPSTSIKFSLPKAEFVTLKIYNEEGQQVSEPVNQKLAPGVYNFSFDASMLASGIYYYKLLTTDYSDTKKMVLIK